MGSLRYVAVTSTAPAGSVRVRRGYPILAGAVVGLVTGLVGLFVTTALYASPWGGMVGAVGCGVTAAYLSGHGVFEGLRNAVVADVVSSVAFFLLFLIGYLVFVWFTEGLSALSAALFTGWFVGIFGLGVAVPVGTVSLVVAAVSGAVTALLKRRLTGPV